MKQLNRLHQCKNCPWKKTTNPYLIPGYDGNYHETLKKTIFDQSNLEMFDFQDYVLKNNPIPVMQCHESNDENPDPCIGYLHNQLGAGNNIVLRVHMLTNYDNHDLIEIDGEQHGNFEDTYPKAIQNITNN